MPSEFLDDDGGLSSDFVFVEATPEGIPVTPQALWFGVRPGYGPDNERLPEPTIWIQYQERAMNSRPQGMVALSPAAWNVIDQAVRWRLAEWKELSEPDVILPPGRSADHGGGGAEGDQFAQPELPFARSESDGDGDRHEEVMHPDHRS